MRKLDPATFRTMPWKNGGGTTTELLTLPAGAGPDAFDVRITRADVTTNGPFSHFEGVDRTLVVTAGAGMTLELADGASVDIDQTSRPFGFTADDPCHATLTDGPVTDLNVMTRRSAFRHRATRITVDGDRSVTCDGELTLLAVLAGDLVATDEGGQLALSTGDILTLSSADPLVITRGAGSPTEVLLVDFTRR